MLAEIPRFHRAARALLPAAAGRHDRRSASSCDRHGFSPYFVRHFMEPRRRRGLVVRPGRGAGVPRALPVRVPRPPRDARRHRLADLADGDRRLARVRRPGRRRPLRARYGSAPRSPRCRDRPTASRSTDGNGDVHDVRRGGDRDPPRPGAGDAGRADARAARVLSAHSRTPPTRRCCTPTPRCCRGRRGPGRRWNFLRAGRRRAAGSRSTYDLTRLQRLDHRDPLPGDPRRRDLVDPADGDRARWSTSTRSTRPASVAAQRRLPELDTDADRVRRRLPRLGLPRGRCPLRAGGRRAARVVARWLEHRLATAARWYAAPQPVRPRSTDHDRAHPRARRSERTFTHRS